jgi:hypothetical protein
MNYKDISIRYNKLMYLYQLDKNIWNYKYNILDKKIKLVFSRQLHIIDYYKDYEEHYYNLINTYNYFNYIL